MNAVCLAIGLSKPSRFRTFREGDCPRLEGERSPGAGGLSKSSRFRTFRDGDCPRLEGERSPGQRIRVSVARVPNVCLCG
jgi:hypothetical protein